MSSSVSTTLSGGAELLAHYDTLLPGPSESEVSTKSQAASSHSSTTVSGSVTSTGGDTVELSAEAMQLLQQMGHGATASHDSTPAVQSYSTPPTHETFDYFG